MTDPLATPFGTADETTGGADPAATARIAELEQRLARLEGSRGLGERSRGLMASILPPEAGTHFRNAGREQLLGIRSIVDHWIGRLDASEANAAGGRSIERETIRIE